MHIGCVKILFETAQIAPWKIGLVIFYVIYLGLLLNKSEQAKLQMRIQAQATKYVDRNTRVWIVKRV
jgi:hypothetical protein